jgi:hypothetical protein
VATKLKAIAVRSARPLRDVVNELLRLGLARASEPSEGTPFAVEVRDLGRRRAGLSQNDIADLLERVEGPFHR